MSKVVYSIIFLCLSWPALSGQAQNTSADVKEKKQAEPTPIPVTQITDQADLVQQQVQELNLEVAPTGEVSALEQKIPLILDSLKKMQKSGLYEDLENQELRVLSSVRQEWKVYKTKLGEWKGLLLDRSQRVNQNADKLHEMQKTWQLTKKEVIKTRAPDAIINRVSAILKTISDAEKQTIKRLNELLVLQNNVSGSYNEIDILISRITKVEQNRRGNIFVRDSPPIWEMASSKADSLQLSVQFRDSWEEIIRAISAFVQLNINRFYLHLSIFVILLILMIYIYIQNRKKRLLDGHDEILKNSAFFISRPLSAALLITLFFSVWIYPDTSETIAEFLVLLFLIPVLFLTPGIILPVLRKPVYIIASLYLLDLLQNNAVASIFLQRISLLAATLVLLVTLSWLIRPQGSLWNLKLKGVLRILRGFSPVIFILLLISLIANIYGSVSFAKTLTWGVLESSIVLVIIYMTASVASGLVTVLIRRRRERAMQFVRTYAYKMERWAKLTISLIAFFIWLRATLRFLNLLTPVKSLLDSLREITWKVGTLEISVNAISDFILVLILTFIIVRVFRIFMDMEVFPRLKLPKGLPAAINMTIRYFLVALGIFLALSSLGVDLSKFGILAGALGVGFGFGLQKIVANFISSLIIAFGRMIRVGDTIQYEDVFGSIREIGVNASTVRTFDGSDAIIPNADLISNKVTNWTLMDMQRRMLLPVKVAFGNNPHEVLKVLEKVVLEHPDVLKSPEPFAVFNGFGDNFLDFSLYYWIPTNLFFKVKTEVALAVHDAITARGIQTPRPQRDLRLTMTEKSKKSTIQEIKVKERPQNKRSPKQKPD